MGFPNDATLGPGSEGHRGLIRKKSQVKVPGRRKSPCKDPAKARRGSVSRTSRRVVSSGTDSRIYFPKSYIRKEGEVDY